MKTSHSRNGNLQSKKLTDGRYVYYPAEGQPIYITPGIDAPEEIIIMLDEMDHDESLSERYEDRHRDYETENIWRKVADANDSADDDPIETLPDPKADVFTILFPEEVQTSELRSALIQAVEKLTPQQIDFIYDRFGLCMSEVDIAERDGVTKQAVFNRQKKLFNRIRKLLGEHENA